MATSISKKRIPELPELSNIQETTLEGFIAYDDGEKTYSIKLENLLGFFIEQVKNSVNNFSRTIEICENELNGIGTIEEQIATYLNQIDYVKNENDNDVLLVLKTCDNENI